jgi:hypothetical protein
MIGVVGQGLPQRRTRLIGRARNVPTAVASHAQIGHSVRGVRVGSSEYRGRNHASREGSPRAALPLAGARAVHLSSVASDAPLHCHG